MSSRLLQQWIKPVDKHTPEPASTVPKDPQVAKQQWNDIFKKNKPQETEPASPPAVPVHNEIEPPKLIHTFRLDPVHLRALKPKVHSFFAKKNTSVVPVTSAKLIKQVERHANFDVVHLRPQKTWETRVLPRRKREGSSLTCKLTRSMGPCVPGTIHASQRLLCSQQQIKGILELNDCMQFSEMCTTPSLFDLGEFEYRMWCEKYSPTSSRQHIQPEQAGKIREWLVNQFELRAKISPNKKKRRKPQSFVVEDDFVEEVDDVLVVSGGVGSGKTSAVYAASAELDAFVFEVHSAMKRTGKELHQVLEGIMHNHAVHKAKRVVVLIDDCDIIYENEAGTFWPAIAKFVSTSRRPVVLTTSTPFSVHLGSSEIENINLGVPNGVKCMDTAWSIALAEGHLLDKTRVARLVVKHKADLRKVLTELQFWCQMGIGGHPSGSDWAPRATEDGKVVSKTWFPLPEEEEPVDNEHDNDNDNDAKRICSRSVPEDTVWIQNAIKPSVWMEPVQFPETGNEALQYQACPYGTVDSNVQKSAFMCEVMPYLRCMAASDRNRAAGISEIIRQRTPRETRLLRRAWSAQGYDTRSYLELPLQHLENIARTGFPQVTYSRDYRLPGFFEQ